MKDRGYQDPIVIALVAGMMVRGDQAAAISLLADYLENARREIRPVPVRLQEFLSASG